MIKNNIELSIVIPAFNEAEWIGGTVQKTAKYLHDNNLYNKTELIVVATKAQDNTAKIAKANKHLFKQFVVIEPNNKVGKGRDVRLGILKATGKYRLFMDADLATPLLHITQAYEELKNGNDVVYGVRDINTMHHKFIRKFSSKTANLLIRFLLLPGVKDSQCGFKAINWHTAKVVYDKQTIDQWGFDIEMLYLAKKYQLKTLALPISDWHDPKTTGNLGGESPLQAMAKTFSELIKIRLNSWRGIYK